MSSTRLSEWMQCRPICTGVWRSQTCQRSSYAAAKHALHGFFDSLRAEVYENDIKITIACPGFVQTNVSINALTGDGSPQNKMDTT